MFTIKGVDIIPTQAGRGLKIKDFEIGCARIVSINTDTPIEDDKTLSLGMTYSQDKGLFFDTKNIGSGKNYVLIKIEGDNVSTITSPKDICDIFELDEKDADTLGQYIGALANDRQLVLTIGKDLEGEDIMYFTNAFDKELSDDFRNGDIEKANEKYLSMMKSAEYRAEYTSDNFIKMFLIAIIQSSQDRYNKVNRNDKLLKVAELLTDIKYWNDGQLLNPSILDIENYINDIKSAIKVK